MDVKGFVDTSLADWDGKVASTIFTSKCNLKCPFCHNHELLESPEKYETIPEESLFKFWKEYKNMLDGVCITGGEPTLEPDLENFCRKVKELGFKVKLDTNGTNPEVLENLIEKKLIDYVAMDVKAPLESAKHKELCGVNSEILEKVKKSIQLLINSDIDYEFRTTVVPSLLDKNDIEEIAKSLKGAKIYILQKFRPENCKDEKLNKQKEQLNKEMDELVELANKHVKTKWRGNPTPIYEKS